MIGFIFEFMKVLETKLSIGFNSLSFKSLPIFLNSSILFLNFSNSSISKVNTSFIVISCISCDSNLEKNVSRLINEDS